MKEKILDIITECKLGEITTDEATRQVLDLFTVMQRSEQLPCDCVTGFEGDIPITFEMCKNCKAKI